MKRKIMLGLAFLATICVSKVQIVEAEDYYGVIPTYINWMYEGKVGMTEYKDGKVYYCEYDVYIFKGGSGYKDYRNVYCKEIVYWQNYK